MRGRARSLPGGGFAALPILFLVSCSGGGEAGGDEQFAERAEALGLVPGAAESVTESESVAQTRTQPGATVGSSGRAAPELESEAETASETEADGRPTAADGDASSGDESRGSDPGRQEDLREDLREATPPPDPDPEPAVDSAGARACAAVGNDAAAIVDGGTPYGSQELTCLHYLALEQDPLAVDEFTAMQVAAIGLYNARDARWQKAVEHALSYSELRHSPNLNFAGLKPAYDRGKYSTVISRANVVWNNLDKGYRLDDDDRTFVAEFACRSGVQIHMGGTVSADHDRWCRIWVDRLSREGKPTDEAQSLLEQVE